MPDKKMTDQRAAAKRFAEYWQGKGYEKGESQPFWLSLLRDVYGVEHPEEFISFEDQVHLDHTSFIDGSISATHVLIEQKSLDKDLDAPILQSSGNGIRQSCPIQNGRAGSSPAILHSSWCTTWNTLIVNRR